MVKLITALFLVLVLGACGVNDNSSQADKEHMVKVKNSTISEIDRKNGQEISKHLVNLTTRVPNVKNATAVVIGRYAVVGIDVGAKLERSEVDTIKYTVAETLKKDPQGAKAVVIADPDVTARLKEISDDIQKGKPIQGIMNELSDITGRLMPEVPADLIDPKPKNAPEKPKKKLNQQQQKNLEKDQEQQSNYKK